MEIIENNEEIIAIIGLGYVGLPLALEFGKKYTVIGYDLNRERIGQLMKGDDRTNETTKEQIAEAKKLTLTYNPDNLAVATVFIVTVPTPIDKFKAPDLIPLLNATRLIASHLKKTNLVIYESTVYPGCTEEDCVPVLEQVSGLKFNQDFFCGYSPERINPGDHVRTLTKIRKVTSGSNPVAAQRVDKLYRSIIEAGTYLAPSIKVAEASKAIENAQRDVNISFVNELAIIFDRLGIDTTSVLEAAGTKWNFLNFKPGLVGGHCIGVDPYYLAHKAESVGHHPQVILSGRRINDDMGRFVANKVIKLMIGRDTKIRGARVLILGFTFKENCPDTRNTKVIDIAKELQQFQAIIDVYDPHANSESVWHEYQIRLCDAPTGIYQAIILAVAHTEFLAIDLSAFRSPDTVIYDTKSVWPLDLVDGRL